MTLGLEVLVQLVMAAMTTAPWVISVVSPFTTWAVRAKSSSLSPKPRGPMGATSCWRNVVFMFLSETRSCGNLGPARLGSMVDRSSSTTSVNSGSGVASVRKRPCSLV